MGQTDGRTDSPEGRNSEVDCVLCEHAGIQIHVTRPQNLRFLKKMTVQIGLRASYIYKTNVPIKIFGDF